MTEIKTRIELITPERARCILNQNTANRPLVKRNLENLKLAIKTGQWKMNGDTIRITKDGDLLDGQHRLMAIVETGIACESLIIEGLCNDVFTTIDQGAVRTLGHMMALGGTKNYTATASIIPLLINYKSGIQPMRVAKNKTKEDLLGFYDMQKQFVDEAAAFTTSSKILRSWFSPAYLGFLYYTFCEINKYDADLFFDILKTGLQKDDKTQPIVLREKIIQILSSPLRKEDSLTKSAYCIFAWNAFRSDKKIIKIRWTKKGKNKQDYPRAI